MNNKSKTRTEGLIIFAIIALGLVGGYVYYSSFNENSNKTIEPPIIDGNPRKFETMKLDFSIFDNISYKGLKIYGESPVQPSEGGKDDLFAPF